MTAHVTTFDPSTGKRIDDAATLKTEVERRDGIIFQLMKRMGLTTICLSGVETELEGRVTVNRGEQLYTVHAQPRDMGS
jgi:hypothetical protein